MTTGLVTVSVVFRRRDLVKHAYIHITNTVYVYTKNTEKILDQKY